MKAKQNELNGGQGYVSEPYNPPSQTGRKHPLRDTNPSLEPGQPPLIEPPPRPKFRVSRVLWIGLVLFILGSGPLLTVILLAWLGVTNDPNPNPIGPGMLAFLTFWPSVGLMIIGVIQSYTRYKSAQPSVRQEMRPVP